MSVFPLRKHPAVNDTWARIRASQLKYLRCHGRHFLDKNMRYTGGVYKLAFNESRKVIIDEAHDLNGNGGHKLRHPTTS